MKENEFTNAGYKEVGSRKCKKNSIPIIITRFLQKWQEQQNFNLNI